MKKTCLTFLLILSLFSCFDSKVYAYTNPPKIGFSFAWPGSMFFNPDSESQDFVHNFDSIEKPKIFNGINEVLRINNLNTDVKRRASFWLINIPLFWKNDEEVRAEVRGAIIAAKEKDMPVIIKLIGFVWPDFHFWKPKFNQSISPFNLQNDFEWWGWSNEYIWAVDSPAKPRTNEEALAQIKSGTINVDNPATWPHVWRDWGTPFKVNAPQPNLASPAFLAEAKRKVGIAATEAAAQYKILKQENKAYILEGFIPDNEVTIGFSFYVDPVYGAGAQSGVNSYRLKYCPDNVMYCLPPKPGTYTDEQWIREKSDKYYRPDGKGNELRPGLPSYEQHIIDTARNYLSELAKTTMEAGIPKDKIISQSVLYHKFQRGTTSKDNNTFSITFNDYSSNVGFSLYGRISPNRGPYDRLRLVKQAGYNKFDLVEYFGNINDPYSYWTGDIGSLTWDTTLPQLHRVVIQNFEGEYVPETQWNPQNHTVSTFVKEFYNTASAPICGNGYLEYGEQCDPIPDNIKNINDPTFKGYETTCNDVKDMFGTNSLGCNNCQLVTTSCALKGDSNNDKIRNITDIKDLTSRIAKNLYLAVLDMDNNSKLDFGDLLYLLKISTL